MKKTHINLDNNSENNCNFATNNNDLNNELSNRNEAQLDNRQPMESSTLYITLGEQQKLQGFSRTIETANSSGSIRDVLSAEEREELESRGIDPDWDKPQFRRELKAQAKQNDVWLDDTYLDGKTLLHDHRRMGTSENDVYKNLDGKTVTKINNLSYVINGNHNRNLNAFMDRLHAHNVLFPEVSYIIKGFMDNKNGIPSMVLEQPLINAERNATQEEINNHLQSAGFRLNGIRNWSNGHKVWSNGVYELFDARPANVLLGRDGNLYFFDTVPHSVDYMITEE